MEVCYHAYIYELYVYNPVSPCYGYYKVIERKFGIHVGNTLIQHWFITLGLFKGTMCIISSYNLGSNSSIAYQMLQQYISFMNSAKYHTRLVFADEKLMEYIDIFGTVRRVFFTGDLPYHSINENSRNRYNDLTVVTLKKGDVRPVEYVILKECTDAPLFLQFVHIFLEVGTFQRGNIFFVDICTIYTKGTNICIQETLFEEFGSLMITLPSPYYPNFNPTDLAFFHLD